ncbi:helix-turn-helix domain-containing protein [Anaerotignum sp.]|uniref:helix-turn-helix domain-containing protein n=1 Tax=Anaerotignum sp. TaxID=2039241 RepID=UPI0028ACE45C|nr:helix-turn-helix domain-containing protein [Anaerotignum sp.]
MNFNEKLITLRKTKGLSQDELGAQLQVSRQTISKWELGQSYPDFQRLVVLSDYFGLTLDALVKDVDVQDVRDKNLSDKQISSIYDDIKNAKNILRIFLFLGGCILIFFAVICILGITGVLPA